MLDAFIIEQLRRKEELERDDRIPLEIHIDDSRDEPYRNSEDDTDQRERGVIVIDL